MRKSDDENSLEMGRGLVYIADKFIAFVAYETSSDQAAHLVKIDENTLTTSVIATSSDIEGWNIDIESPMPDLSERT